MQVFNNLYLSIAMTLKVSTEFATNIATATHSTFLLGYYIHNFTKTDNFTMPYFTNQITYNEATQ